MLFNPDTIQQDDYQGYRPQSPAYSSPSRNQSPYPDGARQSVSRRDREEAARLNRRPIRESPGRSYNDQGAGFLSQGGGYPKQGAAWGNQGYQHQGSRNSQVNGLLPMKGEFFLNVTIIDAEQSLASKAGGIFGSFMQNTFKANEGLTNYQDEKLVRELIPEILAWADAAVRNSGWQCRVDVVMLPPLPGSNQPQPFLSLDRIGLPILVVLRVMSLTKLPTRKEGLFGACDYLCDLFNAPPSMDNKLEMRKVAMVLQENISRGEHRIRASVEAVLADQEYHLLHQRGWNGESVALTINQARQQGQGGYHNNYNNHSNYNNYNGYGGGLNPQQPQGMGRYQQW